jgi:hypothetical protein
MGEIAHLRPISASGKQTRIRSVDLDTGEILDGVPILVSPKKRYISEDYTIVFLEAMQSIATDKTLGAQEFRVLAYLISMLGTENNFKAFNQTQIGVEIGMHKTHVNRSIKRLIEKGIIIKGAHIGKGFVYGLNPNFAWRGPAAKWSAASKKAPKLHLLRGGANVQSSEEKPVAAILRENGEPALF